MLVFKGNILLSFQKVIQDSQASFTKGKSCLTNPVIFCEGVDKGRVEDVIYLDFCKGSMGIS